MIKLTIYEDNAQLRESLNILIGGTPGYEVLNTFENCTGIVEETEVWKPDVVILDIDMPELSGIKALQLLRENNNDVKVLMLTIFDDDANVFEAIKSGANGYILKKTPPAKLLECIHDVYEGGAPITSSVAKQVLQMFSSLYHNKSGEYNLTDREMETLRLLVKGYSYKLIAVEMKISIDTVRAHIKKIYEKLHVNSKGEALAKAFKDKIV